ncbi:hypothetical protein BH18VER1_BH18VER1_14390 [soil metagenome]
MNNDFQAMNTTNTACWRSNVFLRVKAHRLGFSAAESRQAAAESAFRRQHDWVEVAELKRRMNDNGLAQDEFNPLRLDEAQSR